MLKYRHQSLSFPHDLRRALKDAVSSGSSLLGYAMFTPNDQATRRIATLSYDFVWIDAKHAALTPESLTSIIRAINFESEGKSAACVRLPNSDNPEWITWALDAGAGSLVFPRISSAEQAVHSVSLATFTASTNGTRSVPPFRLPVAADLNNFINSLNERVGIIVCIEDKEGVRNIEEICKVERVDCIWVDGINLRLSMGLPASSNSKSPNPLEREFLSGLDRVYKAAIKYKKAKGGFAFGPALDKLRKGEREWAVIASDVGHLFQDAGTLAGAREQFQN